MERERQIPTLPGTVQGPGEAHHSSQIHTTHPGSRKSKIPSGEMEGCSSHMIKGYPKSSSPALSDNALLGLGVLWCFIKQVPATERTFSGGQECNSALAKMPHPGHQEDAKNICFPGEGKEGQDSIRNSKNVLRTKRIP